jgi:thioredoxin 1
MAKELTKNNFKSEVLESPLPVVVDFWATWCMPCRMLMPTIEELSREYEGKVAFGKVNVDAENELAGQSNVMSIPTLILFKDGKPVETVVGALPKDKLVALLKAKFGVE